MKQSSHNTKQISTQIASSALLHLRDVHLHECNCNVWRGLRGESAEWWQMTIFVPEQFVHTQLLFYKVHKTKAIKSGLDKNQVSDKILQDR